MTQRTLWIAVLIACACGETGGPPVTKECAGPVCRVEPVVPPSVLSLDGCTYASPLAYAGAGGTEVLVVASETLSAYSLEGALSWSVTLPAPDGEMAFAVATPVLVGDRLIVGYHTVERTTEPHDVNRARERQMIAVVDLAARRIDDAFEPVELTADFPANDGGLVPFTSTNALGRALTYVRTDGAGEIGFVYATFGNARDIQPWHGFIFELDLDAWKKHGAGAAIRSSFLSTPEADCGTPGMSGSRGRVCGGGMWAPAGPLLVEREGGPELFVSTSNGQLDLDRSDFANSVLRLRPGLEFDPGCDADACDDFDPDAPARECVESCRDIFIPRDEPGDPFMWPESGACDGLGIFECWAELDYVGGSTPAYVKLQSGTELLAYPAKDGALYLFDAAHLGTMYDRAQLVSVCGTESDACLWDWAGMIVTQPAVTEVDGEPLLLVPTFMPDTTHPAGVVAVAILEDDDGPKLDVRWQAPSFEHAAAIARFRRHPSRIRLSENGQVAWLVETAARGERGNLLALRSRDGAILIDQPLAGPGYRFTQPLLVGERIFVPSCQPDNGPSALEIYDIH
jgi:hypothetical protein